MAIAGPSYDQSLVGAILSRRFRLTQELGRGGMGAVYAAAPVDGGPTVAVKILHAAYVGNPQVMTRFLEEGRTCMRLVHPNILRVHEVHKAEDGSPYLVMDLLDGVPLSAYTRNGGRIAMAHAVPILQGMLAGLAAAHEQGVVHRDLKPGNVFLARTDAGLFAVKLLDFGIAKVMDVAGGMGNRTKTGMLLGTPAYMSPEQIRSAKDVDARADLWSVGVMFYEMLTGRTAFPAPTEYARLSAVLQSQPEPIERVDPALAPLAGFVVRAMEKDRERRFQSARDMARALIAAGNAKDNPQSRISVVPLSRLPDRPWMAQNAQEEALREEALRVGTAPTVAAPSTPPMDALPPPPARPAEEATTRFDPLQTPGGTLASVTPAPTTGPDLNVVVLPTSQGGGTLTSEARRIPKRRGVSPVVVVLLVVGALLVGLAIGFAIGVTLGQSH